LYFLLCHLRDRALTYDFDEKLKHLLDRQILRIVDVVDAVLFVRPQLGMLGDDLETVVDQLVVISRIIRQQTRLQQYESVTKRRYSEASLIFFGLLRDRSLVDQGHGADHRLVQIFGLPVGIQIALRLRQPQRDESNQLAQSFRLLSEDRTSKVRKEFRQIRSRQRRLETAQNVRQQVFEIQRQLQRVAFCCGSDHRHAIDDRRVQLKESIRHGSQANCKLTIVSRDLMACSFVF
jgi:hypothetical protein